MGKPAAVTRGGRGSRGGRGGGRGGRCTRGRGGNTSTLAGSRNSPAAPPDVPPAADPPSPGNDDHDNSDDNQPEVWPRKRNRKRNMNIREKLVLIRECVEHADEYCPGNKTKFWAMISELLKQQTGYKLISPQRTVTRWVKARIDELVEEEMGSGTEVERNDFKTAVETFSARMGTVAQDIDDALKTRQQRAAENLEAARLENSLIFQLDDEPIPGIDTPPTATQSSRGSSIALGHRSNKRKREASNYEPSSDAVLLANSFRDSTAVSAEALRARHEAPAPAPAPASTAIPAPSNDLLSQRLTTLKEKLDGTRGRVLQALAGLRSATSIGPPATGMPVHPAPSNSFLPGTTADGASIGPSATGIPVPGGSSNSFRETTAGTTEKDGDGNGKEAEK